MRRITHRPIPRQPRQKILPVPLTQRTVVRPVPRRLPLDRLREPRRHQPPRDHPADHPRMRDHFVRRLQRKRRQTSLAMTLLAVRLHNPRHPLMPRDRNIPPRIGDTLRRPQFAPRCRRRRHLRSTTSFQRLNRIQQIGLPWLVAGVAEAVLIVDRPPVHQRPRRIDQKHFRRRQRPQ